MTNLTGQTLGQYQLLEIIHEGDNDVYKGLQTGTNRTVAVKVLGASQAGDPAFVQQFQQDMQFIAALEHPNLLPVLDYGQQVGWLYLVTRYVDSGTLQDRLSQGFQYSLQQVQQLLGAIANALDYLHSKGAVHGNLKPANILIDAQGQPLLADFGYSQGIDLGQQENTYLSPEQAQGGAVDRRTDVYALGVLLYHMLSGETPAPGVVPDLRPIRPDLPPAVAQIILTAMAQYPDQRYPSARDFDHALAAIAGPQPAPVPVAPPVVQAAPQSEPEPKGTSPLVWIVVAVVILLLLAAGCFLFSGLFSDSGDEPVAPAPTLPFEQPPTPEQPVEPAPEQPPVAVIQAPAQAEVGQGIRFDAGASQSTVRIVSYAWEFGDGEGANAVSVRHTYRSPGVYNVILTVTDANDLSGSSNFQINIVESSLERPTEAPPPEELPTEEPPPEELPTAEPPSIQPLPEETPAEGSQ